MSPLSTLRASPRHPPHARRALPHARRESPSRTARLLALAALALLPACDGGDDAAAGQEPAAGPDATSLAARELELPATTPGAEATIDRLVEALTPLDPTLTSDHHDEHLHAQRALVAELRQADADVGVAALRRLREAEIENPLVRRGLLEVGAHAAPDVARPLLVELVQEYGHDFALRNFAVEFLAQTSPDTALEVFSPHLRKRKKPNKTMPYDEFLIRGYAEAARATGTDPTLMLADVATNIWMEDAARHFAVEELGHYPGEYTTSVLRALLVESSGNAYIRRKAAQSLRRSLPAETACEIFRQVADAESDGNMLAFLLDMIRDTCE